MSWLESMTRLDSTRVTIFRDSDSTRVTLSSFLWWLDSSHVFYQMTRLDSSHIKWLVTRVRVIFRKSPNTCWQTLLVCTQRNEPLLVHWSLAGCLWSMLSALTVSPSGRISVCSGSGVSSAREEPKSSDFALHFRIRLVYGDCLSQPHTFIYLFIFLNRIKDKEVFLLQQG